MTRKQYSKEFKLDAVSLVLEQDYTRTEAAKSLGIDARMLGRWVKEHQASDGQAFRGNGKLTPEQEVLDLKISDYLVEVEVNDNISYQDALIIAMKRERAAYELYSDMAAKVPDSHLKEVLEGLAKEEAKHKLFFEAEYDERVLMDN